MALACECPKYLQPSLYGIFTMFLVALFVIFVYSSSYLLSLSDSTGVDAITSMFQNFVSCSASAALLAILFILMGILFVLLHFLTVPSLVPYFDLLARTLFYVTRLVL